MRHLFSSRRFLPLFITQFLGAANDNLFKNALTILVVYQLAANDHQLASELINWIAALFILPFLLFSASAGAIADRIDKALIARATKITELLLVVLAAFALWYENLFFLLAVIFGFGTQSAFFGPVKYALLPQQLEERELVAANGYIEAATFLAILIGTIIGGVVVLREHGIPALVALMAITGLSGLAASRYIPSAPPAASPGTAMTAFNPLRHSIDILRYTYGQKDIFSCILAISWFWITGIVALTQLPALSKQFLQADEFVTTFFLTLFSIGIGIGSVLCQRLLHNAVRADISPLGAIGMALFLCLIWFFSPPLGEGTNLASLPEFLQQDIAPWFIIGFLGASVCGGIYVVPLYALMQQRAEATHRARVIAANNIYNAAGMTLATMTAVALLQFDITVPQIILILGILNLAMALYSQRLSSLPFQSWFWKLLYRVEVRGREQWPDADKRVLIVANHVSLLDALLLHVFVSRDLVFVHGASHPWRGWIHLFLRKTQTVFLDAESAGTFGNVEQMLREGKRCVIFPEGLPSVSGTLEKMRESAALIADNANTMLLYIRIDGAQYTPFSRLQNDARRRLFPKIILTIRPPRRLHLPEVTSEREYRQIAANRLYDFMCEEMFAADFRPSNLLRELLEARRFHGGGRVILEDLQQGKITYRDLIAKSLVLRRLLGRTILPGQKRIGVMLPNSIGTVLTYFALQGLGRTAAMMNFSAGPAQVVSASRIAGIETILTSQRFVSIAKLEPTVKALQESHIKVVYLERLREGLRLSDKLSIILGTFLPEISLRSALEQNGEDEAVILFTSGSEGAPKGVVLSHNNIIANLRQLAVRVDFSPRDVIFSCLPMFHSFGMTAGLFLPLCFGVRSWLYPSPLHYASIPDLIYQSNATILFSTDTFLNGYARFAHQYDFRRLRYVFAGAEKLHEETRRLWSDRYGVRVLQGYGVTETAPVISVNTAMESRNDTVGRALPGIDIRLESEPDLKAGKRLHVRGPNVMKGYMKETAPGEIQPLPDGWHDTGDIATVDEDGYITIVDRFGRFAKIGGEMVSLGAVEAAVGKLWRESAHAVVAIPDSHRGESVILLTQEKKADAGILAEHCNTLGLARLWIPRSIFHIEEVPLLPGGKTDYVKARALAAELRQRQQMHDSSVR